MRKRGVLMVAAVGWGAVVALPSGSPASSPVRFAPITPGRTIVGRIIAPDARATRAREPITADFPSAQDGYLAFRGGRLLATHDGGSTWRRVSERRFELLDFVSPLAGFGVSGRLLFQTEDGGRTWVRVPGIGTAGGLSFVDREHGWVVAADGLYRTSDGGRSWTRLAPLCGEDDGVAVSFVSASLGFGVCGGQPAAGMQMRAYYRTDDSGATWQETAHGAFSGYVSGLEYLSDGVGFERASRDGIDRVPGHETVLFTDDAEDVLSMSWPDAMHGVAVLSHSGLVRTNDGGRHWQRVYPRALPPPSGPLSFSSTRRGIGAVLELGIFTRSGAVLATGDGGAHWTLRGSAGRGEIAALARVSPTVVWAISSDHQGRLVLLRSGDDGRRWGRARSFDPGGESWVSFPTRRTGFLGDDRGHLYRTSDGGRSWRVLRYPRDVEQGVFLSASEGLAITNAQLLATVDGGLTWKIVAVRGLSIAFRALGAFDRTHLWVGGLDLTSDCLHAPCRGLLLRSSDGGRHWTLIRLPYMIGFDGFEWATPRIGYARGPYRTHDGGRTWRFLQAFL